MRTLHEVEKEIAEVQEQLANVKGGETEVYARIVGYYRSVRNWNKGKREEYGVRKMFQLKDDMKNVSETATYTITEADSSCNCGAFQSMDRPIFHEIAYYEFFARKTCPNCPPVKAFLQSVDFAGSAIDVDSEEGFARAAELGVLSAPTVIFFDANGIEIARASSVTELEKLFASEPQRKVC